MDALVLGRLVEGGHQGIHQLAVQRVQRRGPVHGQSPDRTEVLGEQDGLGWICGRPGLRGHGAG
jgi:hypothetical protein